MTIKFLVNLLRIDRKKDEQKRIAEEVNDNLIEHIMSGINLISGQKGRIYLHVSETENNQMKKKKTRTILICRLFWKNSMKNT